MDKLGWDTQLATFDRWEYFTYFLLIVLFSSIIFFWVANYHHTQMHSLLPLIIPLPLSVSFTGAALLGTISYIVALGDPTDQANLISGKTGGGVLGKKWKLVEQCQELWDRRHWNRHKLRHHGLRLRRGRWWITIAPLQRLKSWHSRRGNSRKKCPFRKRKMRHQGSCWLCGRR